MTTTEFCYSKFIKNCKNLKKTRNRCSQRSCKLWAFPGDKRRCRKKRKPTLSLWIFTKISQFSWPVNLFSPELCDDNLVEHGVQIHSASSVYERSEYSIKCCNPLCVTMLPQIPQISMLEVIDFLHVAFLGLVYKTNQGICKLCSTSWNSHIK